MQCYLELLSQQMPPAKITPQSLQNDGNSHLKRSRQSLRTKGTLLGSPSIYTIPEVHEKTLVSRQESNSQL